MAVTSGATEPGHHILNQSNEQAFLGRVDMKQEKEAETCGGHIKKLLHIQGHISSIITKVAKVTVNGPKGAWESHHKPPQSRSTPGTGKPFLHNRSTHPPNADKAQQSKTMTQ